jgi:polyferredoxin
MSSLLMVLVVWAQPRLAIPIRVGDFFASLGLTFQHAGGWWLTRSFLVIGLILMSLVVANLWCRCICPTGGLLQIFSTFSLFKIDKDDKCNDCDKCVRVCEMGCRPAEPNCTNCGDCMGTCPQDAIEIGGHGRRLGR